MSRHFLGTSVGRPLCTASSCPGIAGSAAGGSSFLFCWCSMPLNNRGKEKTAGSRHCKAVFYMSCPTAFPLSSGRPHLTHPSPAGGWQRRRGGRDPRGWGEKGLKVPLPYKQPGPHVGESETAGWILLVRVFSSASCERKWKSCAVLLELQCQQASLVPSYNT